MSYKYPTFMLDEPEENDNYAQYPRKKSINSTEYSFKNTPYQFDSIDQYLILDNNTATGSTGQPSQAHRKKPLISHQAIKLRNKINAKLSRDRKKSQFESLSYQLKELERENYRIKHQRGYCSRCNSKILEPPLSTAVQHKQHKDEGKIEIQFEKPEFKQPKGSTGKIWIAIGIIMLILGVNIHGLDHEPIEINLKKSDITGFRDQLKTNSSTFKLPLSFRDSHKMEMQEKKPGEGPIEVGITGLRVKSIDDQKSTDKSEQHFEISRDFISQLEGEINDIGRYI